MLRVGRNVNESQEARGAGLGCKSGAGEKARGAGLVVPSKKNDEVRGKATKQQLLH